MTPPKKQRAIFSLNVDSHIESLYDKRTPYHSSGHTDREGVEKVVEIKKPVAGSTHLEIVKNKAGGGDRTVEKKEKKSVHLEGFGSLDREKEHKDGVYDDDDDGRIQTTYTTESATGPSVHTTIRKQKKSVDVDEQYDTSDL